MTDIGHYGPALAVGSYGIVNLWLAMGKEEPVEDKEENYEIKRETFLQRLTTKQKIQLIDAIAYVLVGILITIPIFIVLCYCGTHSRKSSRSECVHQNTMHLFLGILLILAGVLQALWTTPLLSRYPDTTPVIVFASIGFMFFNHHQDSMQELLIHQVLGITMFLAGLFKTIATDHHQWKAFTAILILYSAILIIFGMPSVGKVIVNLPLSAGNAISLSVLALLMIVVSTTLVRFAVRYFIPSRFKFKIFPLKRIKISFV